MLNWGLCHGHAVIPKAATPKYQFENLDIFDFQLTDEEVANVDKLNTGRRMCNFFDMGCGGNFDVFA